MRNLLIGVQLFEQAGRIIDHVGTLGELILGCLDLLDRKERNLYEMGEQRKGEVTIQVGNDCLREIVLGHFFSC